MLYDYETRIERASESELFGFARAMVEADAFEARDGVIDLLESPWKWGKLYEAWSLLGQPRGGQAGWERFADLLARGDAAVREWLIEREEAL